MAIDEDAISTLLSGITEPEEAVDELTLEDATWAVSDTISALLLGSRCLNEKVDALSPEDAAWVDSCLAIGSELSDDSWSALKEALLDTLSAQPTSYGEPSTADIDKIQEERDENVQVSSEADTAVIRDEQQILPMDPEGENEEAHVEAVVSSHEDIDPLENIFKVWDLESPDEEDGLVKQLKKLLSDSKLKVPPAAPNDPSMAANDMEIHKLITSFADLSF